jgi:hypothetical protein
MPRNYLIIAAIVFILLAPVAADILPSAKKLQQEFHAEKEAGLSDTFKAMKEHVHERKEELKDTLKKMGATFKAGVKEAEAEAEKKMHDQQEPLPGLDNMKQAACNVGSAECAAKESAEKVKEDLSIAAKSLRDKTKGAADATKQKLQDFTDSAKDAAHDTQHSFNDAIFRAKESAETAKEKLEVAGETVKEKLETAKDAVKEKFVDAAHSAQRTVERTKEAVKEKVKGAVDSAKETAQHASEKLKAGAETLKEDAEDVIGHAKFQAERTARKAEEATEERLRNLKDEVKEESAHIKGGLQHGAEELSKKGANLRDEVAREAEHVAKEARGMWNWLSGWMGDTKDKLQAELKKEEALTKAKIAQRTYQAAVEREAAAKRALAEYEALKAKVYGARHAAGEVKGAVHELGTKVQGAADKLLDKIKGAAHRVKDTAEDAKDTYYHQHLTEGEQIGIAKPGCAYKADDASHHFLEYNPEQEKVLREELRQAKEEREHITDVHKPMPMHGKSIGDRLRGWFAV